MSKYHKKKRVTIKTDTNLTNQGLEMADDTKQDVVEATISQDQTTTSETQVANTQEETTTIEPIIAEQTTTTEEQPIETINQQDTVPVEEIVVQSTDTSAQQETTVDTNQETAQTTINDTQQPVVAQEDTTQKQDQIVTDQDPIETTQQTEQSTITVDKQSSTDTSITQPADTVIQSITNIVDQTTTEVVNTEASTNITSQSQDTQQQPVEQPAVVDTSAVNNTVNQSTVSTSPEIIDTKEQNLTDFEKFEQQVLNEGVEHEKNLVLGLREYLEYMKPKKPIDVQEGLLRQRQLLEHIKGVLKIEDKQNFRKCWKLLIKYFHHHSQKGNALHETYINRFTEHWSTGPDQLNAFRNLTHLLKETAQKGVGNVHKTVSLDIVTRSKYFSDEERQKILDFYNS